MRTYQRKASEKGALKLKRSYRTSQQCGTDNSIEAKDAQTYAINRQPVKQSTQNCPV